MKGMENKIHKSYGRRRRRLCMSGNANRVCVCVETRQRHKYLIVSTTFSSYFQPASQPNESASQPANKRVIMVGRRRNIKIYGNSRVVLVNKSP